MLLDDYFRVSEAATPEAFKEALVAFAERLGFPLVAATLVQDKPAGASTFLSVTNTPPDFMEAAMSAEDGRRDPVLQQAKVLNTPVLWDQTTYVRANAADLWEVQSPFGYHTGILIPLHLPHGRHFLLGVDRDKKLPKGDARLGRLVADLQLLATHAQNAALRLLASPLGVAGEDVPKLTPRELEILRLIVQGKSNWAMGQLLGISPSTIKFHVDRVLQKLDCGSRHTAVLKAMQFGLL